MIHFIMRELCSVFCVKMYIRKREIENELFELSKLQKI